VSKSSSQRAGLCVCVGIQGSSAHIHKLLIRDKMMSLLTSAHITQNLLLCSRAGKIRTMTEIKLSNGMSVLKSNYVKLKTKDLIVFGYAKLTEEEVSEQVDKIVKGDKDLSVIGMFCKDDLDVR
jgi:hypothetical protein